MSKVLKYKNKEGKFVPILPFVIDGLSEEKARELFITQEEAERDFAKKTGDGSVESTVQSAIDDLKGGASGTLKDVEDKVGTLDGKVSQLETNDSEQDTKIGQLETKQGTLESTLNTLKSDFENQPGKYLYYEEKTANFNYELQETLTKDGDELHYIVYNSSGGDITVTLPISVTLCNDNSLTIGSGKYGEINVVRIDGVDYLRTVA